MTSTPVQPVRVYETPITLQNLLKFANLVPSGGEAKIAITAGQVTVNGATETRRGRKLSAGDVVGYAGKFFEIVTGD
jgi:ribosome-associated protein